MSLWQYALSMIVCISAVNSSINQIRFPNKSDAICVYLFESIKMNVTEVKFTIALDLSVCQFDERISRHPLTNTKEMLIIQLSNNCSLIQQLTVLNNISSIHHYLGIIFSINRTTKSFEQTLLSYFHDPGRSPSVSTISNSRFSRVPPLRISGEYDLNRTIIGFIDSNKIIHLRHLLSNQSNPSLFRVQRENRPFDPVIFLILSFILICMLLGNEWHRKLFLNKVVNHYQNHSKKSTKFQIGLIIGLLLFICLVLLYLFDRYFAYIIIGIYLDSFLIFSTFIVYLFLDYCCYLLIETIAGKFKKTHVQLDRNYALFRWILLFISFLLTLVWFFNRFTSSGFIFSNGITCAMTILIIVQMRIGNLMICLIIYGFIVLFESLSLMVIGFEERSKRNFMMAHLISPMRAWTTSANNGNDVQDFIQRLYSNMFENSGFDCLLSGGSMNVFRTNALQWVIKESLPLVFRFPGFTRDNDGCGFSTSRIYFSIDDLIFPSLLINFCRLFDIGNNIPLRIYYLQALVSYLLSFLLSYIIMFITPYDQLSSIIVYPCLIISTMITGTIRGELEIYFKDYYQHLINNRHAREVILSDGVTTCTSPCEINVLWYLFMLDY